MRHSLVMILSAWAFFVLMFSLCGLENDSLSQANLAPVEREFPLRVSPSNQNLYMDGPDALKEVKQRNQEIIDSRRFPWIWLVLLISCSGIGWAAFLYRDEWMEYFRKRVGPLNPLQQSYARLQELQQVKLFETDQYKTYYGELTTLLKEVLQERLRTVFVSLTTEEIIKTLGMIASLHDDEKSEILTVFAQADAIKYANQTPTEKEAEKMFKSVQSIVTRLCAVDKNSLEKGLK